MAACCDSSTTIASAAETVYNSVHGDASGRAKAVKWLQQHLLKGNHKVHRVEMIDIMVPVPREASAAWDHEPYVLVDVQLVIRGPEVTRATMLVMRQIGTDVLTRKISVKGHVLALHLVVLQ